MLTPCGRHPLPRMACWRRLCHSVCCRRRLLAFMVPKHEQWKLTLMSEVKLQCYMYLFDPDSQHRDVTAERSQHTVWKTSIFPRLTSRPLAIEDSSQAMVIRYSKEKFACSGVVWGIPLKLKDLLVHPHNNKTYN